MEEPDRLRLLLVGLFLAAIAVGYVIFTQRYNSGVARLNPTPRPIQQITEVSPSPTPSPTASPLGGVTGGVVSITKGGMPTAQVSNLPNTGGPTDFLLFASVVTAVAGLVLRKFSS